MCSSWREGLAFGVFPCTEVLWAFVRQIELLSPEFRLFVVLRSHKVAWLASKLTSGYKVKVQYTRCHAICCVAGRNGHEMMLG